MSLITNYSYLNSTFSSSTLYTVGPNYLQFRTSTSAGVTDPITGTIVIMSRTSLPGWLLCNGEVKNQSDFPGLYAVIGAKYNIGGEAVGTFRIPDVSTTGRHLWGSTSNTLPSTIAQGGANNHAHNTNYAVSFGIAATTGSHSHNVNAITANTGNASNVGYHGHYNLGNNTAGSGSNFIAGNGTRTGGSIDTHTHYIVGYIDAGDHNHNHNHNGTNVTYSGNHETNHTLTPSATSSNITFTGSQSLDAFVANLIIKT